MLPKIEVEAAAAILKTAATDGGGASRMGSENPESDASLRSSVTDISGLCGANHTSGIIDDDRCSDCYNCGRPGADW